MLTFHSELSCPKAYHRPDYAICTVQYNQEKKTSEHENGALAGMVTRNTHTLVQARSYMNHRNALTATTAIVIHTTVQLCVRAC
jgi:hypothetical protein